MADRRRGHRCPTLLRRNARPTRMDAAHLTAVSKAGELPGLGKQLRQRPHE
ncbi:hypothetical protein ACRAWF_41170 [Streptomyces sp. L7]